MAWTAKKTGFVVLGAIGGGMLLAVTGGLAAPAIGAMIGTGLGLSGAAATSAGLAALGGGALTAGGGGMAAGTAAIVTGAAVAGAATGAAGAAAAAKGLDDVKRCATCDVPLDDGMKFCPQCGKRA